MDPPTANDVKSATGNITPGNVPGVDEVSAEMLKTGGDVIAETHTEMFKEMWKKNKYSSNGRLSLNCQEKET